MRARKPRRARLSRAKAARAIQGGAGGGIELRPVRPSIGLEAAYRRRLYGLIDEMQASIMRWVRAAYRANSPEMAADASPARELNAAVRKLKRRWLKRFDEASEEIAAYYATAAAKRSDAALKAALKKGGFAVEFRMTKEANDVLQATIAEQVGLIRSLPAQQFAQVQGAVLRSVQQGRDLATLSKELQEQHGVTKRRAATISRDQNNKATASMTRVRQQQLGISRARWLHSGGGKHPRPEHVAFANGSHSTGGPIYEVEKGAFLEGKWVWPGTEINCRCVSRPIIEALQQEG